MYGSYLCARIELCRAKLLMFLGRSEDLGEISVDSGFAGSGSNAQNRNTSPTLGTGKVKSKAKSADTTQKAAVATEQPPAPKGISSDKFLSMAEKILLDLRESSEKSDIPGI